MVNTFGFQTTERAQYPGIFVILTCHKKCINTTVCSSPFCLSEYNAIIYNNPSESSLLIEEKTRGSPLKFIKPESDPRRTQFSNCQVKLLKESQTGLVSGNFGSVHPGAYSDRDSHFLPGLIYSLRLKS